MNSAANSRPATTSVAANSRGATTSVAAEPTSPDVPISPPFATTSATVGNTTVPICRPLPRRLLGVWAHPDDEAYLSAGLMARVIDAGGHVTVVTATSGEWGSGDPEVAGTADFARRRQDELRSSLSELGVDDVRFLGVADGGCEDADADHLVGEIASVIGEVRPDSIVTFGPDGITGHPDHRAVSRWTTDAWRDRNRDGELLYAAMTEDHLETWADLHAELGLFTDFGATPAGISPWSVALQCMLNDAELDRKRRALAGHGSQTAPLAAMIGEDTYRSWVAGEWFRSPTWTEARGGHRMVGATR